MKTGRRKRDGGEQEQTVCGECVDFLRRPRA